MASMWNDLKLFVDADGFWPLRFIHVALLSCGALALAFIAHLGYLCLMAGIQILARSLGFDFL